ncbi:hypothetical protein ACFE04_013150 [Oxalis oulophora]
MGPIRSGKSKKNNNKKNKKDDQNALHQDYTSSPSPPPQLHSSMDMDWWLDLHKNISGPLRRSSDLKQFGFVFNISTKTFNYICSLVKEDMRSSHAYTNGPTLTLKDKVAVALRRLSSGETLTNIGESFGMNQSTVSQITWRFVESMEERGLHHLQWPSMESDMENIKSKFEKIEGLPNCCGAIDITHILMNIPTLDDKSSGVWCNAKKQYSMILQAIVDPHMRFQDVIAGWPGSLSDAQVLQNSGFFKLCEDGKRLNGKNEYIVGDSGFPLLQWLITPYQGKELSDIQAEFNRRHAATRLVASMALARLKKMWRIIKGVMWMPDKTRLPRIILVCCLLHNIIIDMKDEVLDEMSLSCHHDPEYKQQFCEAVNETALTMRDKLSLHLSQP